MNGFFDLLFLFGIGLILYGIWLIFPPMSIIILGGIIIGFVWKAKQVIRDDGRIQ